MKMNTWIHIGNIKDFPSNSRSLFTLEINSIHLDLVLLQDRNAYKCIEATCPHSGGPLHLGDIEEIDKHRFLVCPWHAYRFSLENGSSLDCEDHGAQVYPVEIREEEQIWICVYAESVSVVSHPVPVPSLTSDNASPPCLITLTVSESTPMSGKTLSDWAIQVLKSLDYNEKVNLTLWIAKEWNSNHIIEIGKNIPPSVPSRSESLSFTSPNLAPKRGNAGTLESRISILHALANIELWAIDLAWDIIARFHDLPREFYTDFIKVASDEAKHFQLLQSRLLELNSFYGALPVHGSLWDSAMETSHDILARLAIVHMVHEARGLDVNPKTIQKFKKANDLDSCSKLEIIHNDEISHVAYGQKWFSFICQERGLEKYSTFHSLVRKYFRGYFILFYTLIVIYRSLIPPFNEQDRLKAGLDAQFYLPLQRSL